MMLGTGLIFRLPEGKMALKPQTLTGSGRDSCEAGSGVAQPHHLVHRLGGDGGTSRSVEIGAGAQGGCAMQTLSGPPVSNCSIESQERERTMLIPAWGCGTGLFGALVSWLHGPKWQEGTKERIGEVSCRSLANCSQLTLCLTLEHSQWYDCFPAQLKANSAGFKIWIVQIVVRDFTNYNLPWSKGTVYHIFF